MTGGRGYPHTTIPVSVGGSSDLYPSKSGSISDRPGHIWFPVRLHWLGRRPVETRNRKHSMAPSSFFPSTTSPNLARPLIHHCHHVDDHRRMRRHPYRASRARYAHQVLQQLSMRGKVTAITGASDGIGLAVAEAMAEAGGDVVLLSHTNCAAVQHALRLQQLYQVRTLAIQCDLSIRLQVHRAIDQIESPLARLDVSSPMPAWRSRNRSCNRPSRSSNADRRQRGRRIRCAKRCGELFQRQGFGNLIITSSMSAHTSSTCRSINRCTMPPRLPSPIWANRWHANGVNSPVSMWSRRAS